MSDSSLKNLLLAILAALAAISAAIGLYMSGGATPIPQPSPSPSALPSPVASPSPSPSPSPTATATQSPVPVAQTLKLMSGMTEGFEMVATTTEAAQQTIGSLTFDAQLIQNVTTTMPTYAGLPVGAYPDLITPVTQVVKGSKYWVDVKALPVSVNTTQNVAAFGVPLSVTIYAKTFAWPVPLYMEMTFAAISSANGLADVGQTFAQRVALNQKYAALLRAHGVEPIKQGVNVYSDSTFTGNYFKELVLTGNIAPPCLFGPSPNAAPSVAYLQAVELAIKVGTLPAGTWAYAWDEGEGNAGATAAALARVKLIKQYAPSLKVMITRQYDASFAPYVDIFVPVVNWYNQPGYVPASSYAGKTVWLYASCMSANRCNNATAVSQVGAPSKFPVMALDAPDSHATRFVTELVSAGAEGLLYYDTTYSMGTALNAGGQYFFGNNGDGNYLYKDLGMSRRLKFIRRGMNQVALKNAGL